MRVRRRFISLDSWRFATKHRIYYVRLKVFFPARQRFRVCRRVSQVTTYEAKSNVPWSTHITLWILMRPCLAKIDLALRTCHVDRFAMASERAFVHMNSSTKEVCYELGAVDRLLWCVYKCVCFGWLSDKKKACLPLDAFGGT